MSNGFPFVSTKIGLRCCFKVSVQDFKVWLVVVVVVVVVVDDDVDDTVVVFVDAVVEEDEIAVDETAPVVDALESIDSFAFFEPFFGIL